MPGEIDARIGEHDVIERQDRRARFPVEHGFDAIALQLNTAKRELSGLEVEASVLDRQAVRDELRRTGPGTLLETKRRNRKRHLFEA